MKTPSRVRPPTLGERLGRLGVASLVPGGLAVEATNQVLDERSIPSRPTPGSAPQSVAVPPEGTPMPLPPPRPIHTAEQAARDASPRALTTPELVGKVARRALVGAVPSYILDQDRAAHRRRGPTPGSEPQSYTIPPPPSVPIPAPPLPIVNPEIIELVRAVNRGEISLEQAEEFARAANRSETLDKSGVSALLQASRDRARGA